jgi:hypothetical protein
LLTLYERNAILMNNLLKYVLSVFFAASLTSVNGQFKPEYVFGINLATMSVKSNGVSYDTKTPVSFHFGASTELPLNDNFAIMPALLFSAKGTDYETDNISYSISPIYLEMPITAACSFGSNTFKVTFFSGGYIAFGISGYKIVGAGELQSINFGKSPNDDLKSFDGGLIFGAGFNIKGLLISAQYGMGLANLSPVASADTEMKNKVIGISLSNRNKSY